MSETIHREVFRKGSKTYFNSSLFFPKSVRADVYVLYGFVRIADDFVDSVPQRPDEFYRFRSSYERCRDGVASGDTIIDSFVELERRKQFQHEWTTAFFASMEMDLKKSVHKTLAETLEYVYGSAEVIGLYMSRIMGLDVAADRAACMLGRAMQFINFIRDVNEDNGLGRTYLPADETTLPDLREQSVLQDPDEFLRYIRAQVERYREWQSEAEAGYRYIPHRYLVPIRTASDMYGWTATVIERNPLIVFQRKVKPSRARIVRRILRNALSPWPGAPHD